MKICRRGITDSSSANTLVAQNWIARSPVAVRFFGSPGFGGGATAAFINNGGGAILDLPALDSSANCVLSGTGVQVYAQGASVPNPNLFEGNWWGAPTGPNTAGASTADGSIDAIPFLGASRRLRRHAVPRRLRDTVTARSRARFPCGRRLASAR